MSSSRAVYRRDLAHRLTNIFTKIYEKTVPQPHPPHKGSTFHRRIQYLQTGKLWRGFLQKSTMKTFLQRTKFISGSNWQTFFYAEGKKTFCAEINNNHIAFPMLSTSTDPCLGDPARIDELFGFFCFTVSLIHICSFPTAAHFHTCSASKCSHLDIIITSPSFSVFLSLFLSILFLSLFSLSPSLSVLAGSHEMSTLSEEMRVDGQKLR